jgi:transcriptional regulator
MAGRSEDLIQGTLDMLILKTLTMGRLHGYAIVQRIQQVSNDVLQIEEGSLYPALHRMEQKGWVASEWGVSENNRRARYYVLTKSGRKQLKTELSLWSKLSAATSRVLDVAPERG